MLTSGTPGGEKKVPESLGLAPGVVFLVCIILFQLLKGQMRFGELSRAIPSVTQRMMTLQLRELEEAGIITRTVHPEVPPRVEYALTDLGRTLEPVLVSMRDWGRDYTKSMVEPEIA